MPELAKARTEKGLVHECFQMGPSRTGPFQSQPAYKMCVVPPVGPPPAGGAPKGLGLGVLTRGFWKCLRAMWLCPFYLAFCLSENLFVASGVFQTFYLIWTTCPVRSTYIWTLAGFTILPFRDHNGFEVKHSREWTLIQAVSQKGFHNYSHFGNRTPTLSGSKVFRQSDITAR